MAMTVDPAPTGYEHNFNTYDDNRITDLNTPYDYESVMHYAPFSFNQNENVPTITTKIPEFNTIIGQRLDLSATDLERLNRMYNCSKNPGWGRAPRAQPWLPFLFPFTLLECSAKGNTG